MQLRSGVVLAQLAVAAKTNEIPMLAPLNRPGFDLDSSSGCGVL